MSKVTSRRRKSKEEKLNEAKEIIEAHELSEEAEGDIEDINETDAELEEAIGFDIFEFGDKQQKAGDQVKYIIKRNGEMLTSRFHPFSWEKLQEEYGGGQYQVIARSMVKQKYLKSETRPVASPGNNYRGETNFAFGRPKSYYENDRVDKEEKKADFTEMWGLISKSSQDAKEEAREIARREKELSSTMITSLMTMMQSSQAQSQTLFLEMMKANQEGLNRISENTNQMFREMNEKFEKIVDKIAEKPRRNEEFGIYELMKLQNDSREQGFDMFNKMSELAEAKAEEKAEILAGKEDGEGKKEKSLTESVVEALLPALSASLSNKNPSIHSQNISYQGQNAHPIARRSVPQITRRENSKQIGPGTIKIQNEENSEAKNNEIKTNSGEIGRINRAGSIKINKVGLTGEKKQEKVDAQILSNKENAKVWQKDVERDAIEEILTPVIVDCLLNMRKPEEGTNLLKKVLTEQQITPKKFFAKIPKEYIIEIVRKYELPDEARSWFEEVYANLQSSTGMDNR